MGLACSQELFCLPGVEDDLVLNIRLLRALQDRVWRKDRDALEMPSFVFFSSALPLGRVAAVLRRMASRDSQGAKDVCAFSPFIRPGEEP
jgi:hypothetical protein